MRKKWNWYAVMYAQIFKAWSGAYIENIIGMAACGQGEGGEQ